MNNRKREDQETIQITAEKAYYLQRIEVLSEVKDALIKWAKGRFWALSLIFAAIVFVGGGSLITFLVEARVDSRIRSEIQRYETKLQELREITAVAKSTTEESSAAAKNANSKLKEFENKAKFVDEKYQEVVLKIQSNSENIKEREELANSAILQRIKALEDYVVKTSPGSSKQVASFAAERARIEVKQQEDKKKFDNNSQYEIGIVYDKVHEKEAQSIAKHLAKAGFKVKKKYSKRSQLELRIRTFNIYSRIPMFGDIASWNADDKLIAVAEILKSHTGIEINRREIIRRPQEFVKEFPDEYDSLKRELTIFLID